MRRYIRHIWNSFRKGDMILLMLCLAMTSFGMLVISSTTNAVGYSRYLVIQLLASLLGILVYAIVSSVDVEFMAEHRLEFTIFNVFLLLLLIPFGTDNGSGNRSWLDFPLLPVDIQPAEICKIFFIIIAASVMNAHQNRPSSLKAVTHLGGHMLLLLGLNMVLSRDLGVSLIFVFIFVGMAISGGMSLLWFLGGFGLLALSFPIWWSMLGEYQQNRIMILFDSSIDPYGTVERYHIVRALKSLTGGGLTGQGLFNGIRTQGGNLFAQHTDYIFSSIGEELGFFGCVFVMVLQFAIIARCIWVGMRCQDYIRRLVCYGAASALMFQVIINVGMCLGVMPVIGLTLPLISYGGSSLVTIFAMLGLVSGAYARPASLSHERYIQPPR